MTIGIPFHHTIRRENRLELIIDGTFTHHYTILHQNVNSTNLFNGLVEQFTAMTFDGLTGAGMTWAATGEVSKAPMAVVIENGTYVSAQ